MNKQLKITQLTATTLHLTIPFPLPRTVDKGLHNILTLTDCFIQILIDFTNRLIETPMYVLMKNLRIS